MKRFGLALVAVLALAVVTEEVFGRPRSSGGSRSGGSRSFGGSRGPGRFASSSRTFSGKSFSAGFKKSGFSKTSGAGFVGKPTSSFGKKPGSSFSKKPGTGSAKKPGSSFSKKAGSGFAKKAGPVAGKNLPGKLKGKTLSKANGKFFKKWKLHNHYRCRLWLSPDGCWYYWCPQLDCYVLEECIADYPPVQDGCSRCGCASCRCGCRDVIPPVENNDSTQESMLQQDD